MPRSRVPLKLPDELIALIDAEAQRLTQTRTAFIERYLWAAVDPSRSVEAVSDGLPDTPAGRASKRPTHRDLAAATDVKLHLSQDGTTLEAWGALPGWAHRYKVGVWAGDDGWQLPGSPRMRPSGTVQAQIEGLLRPAGGAASVLRQARADEEAQVAEESPEERAPEAPRGRRVATSAEARAHVKPIPRAVKPAPRSPRGR